MLCPYCHAENNYDALVCDSCFRELPVTTTRLEEITKKKKQEHHAKFHNSLIKILGLCLGILAIIAVIVIAWIRTKG